MSVLYQVALLFLLFVMFLLGWRVGENVKDEQQWLVKHFGKYIWLYAVLVGMIVGVYPAVFVAILLLNFVFGASTKKQATAVYVGLLHSIMVGAVWIAITFV